MATLSDLSDDLHVSVLSFLSPSEASPFSSTSRRARSLFCSPSLFLAMSCRRWGHLTSPSLWLPDPTPSSARLLHSTLSFYAPAVGLWRHVTGNRLVHFSWTPDSISAFLLSPSRDSLAVAGNRYAVQRDPFLRLSASAEGCPFAVSLPDSRPVNVGFMGRDHLVVAEKDVGVKDCEEEVKVIESTSPPDNVTLELYQHFANRRQSPGGGRRRGLIRGKGSDRETKHLVRIPATEPTQERPLQGLWKGITESMDLEFFLITYDEIGGLSCRQLGAAESQLSAHVFWTSSASFLDPPFSKEELDLYCSRRHIRGSSMDNQSVEEPIVSRIMCMNSSYDIVIPYSSSSPVDTRNVDGRIWLYEDGTFGFGFLRNDFIMDMKHITKDGCILDIVG